MQTLLTRKLYNIFTLFLLVMMAGCSGSGGGGGVVQQPGNQMLAQGPTLVSVEISPGQATIGLGTEIQLTATGLYSDSSTRDITEAVAWTSSNVAVATIDTTSAGQVIAVAPGTINITATIGVITATAQLTVSTATLTSIQLTPVNARSIVGSNQQFTAVGTLSDFTVQDLTQVVTWGSSDPAVADISSAAGSRGLATAKADGKTNITATMGTKSTSTVLSVVPAASLVSLEITPIMPTIANGTSQQFTAMGRFADNTVQDLTSSVAWSSASTAVATISATGLAVGTGAGTTTITASLAGVSDSTVLTISTARLESIDLYFDYPTVPIGMPQQCTASGNFSDGTVQDLTTQVVWQSSNTAVATLSDKGVATAQGPGVTTISATLGNVSGSASLTVSTATLSSVAVSPGTAKIALTTSQQFTATGTDSDGQSYDLTPYVSWSSSDAAVATISNTMGSFGVATSVGVGTTVIKASCGGIVSNGATLTVAQALLTSLAINPINPTLYLWAPQQFSAKGTFTEASGASWQQDLTTQVSWSSSSRKTVAMSNATDSRGVATPFSAGSATITAFFDGIAATTTATVSSAKLTAIAITPANPVLAVGSRLQLAAIGTYDDGNTAAVTQTVKWASSEKSIATVINNPKKRRALLIGQKAGTATITAALRGISGKTTATVQ